jgi:hypothetical protein
VTIPNKFIRDILAATGLVKAEDFNYNEIKHNTTQNCTWKNTICFLPDFSPFWAGYQNILKNICGNEPGMWLK